MTTKENRDRDRVNLAIYKSRSERGTCLNCGRVPGDCQCRSSERVMAASDFDRLQRENGKVKRGR